MWEHVLEAVLHSLKLFPILLLVYVLIEVIENKTASKLKHNKLLKGNFGPLIGSAVGIVPQCGFSVIATDLYTKNSLSLGTLVAVYLATSDEAIPVMLSSPNGYKYILPVLAIKLGMALVFGYLIHLITRGKGSDTVYNTHSVNKSNYIGFGEIDIKNASVEQKYLLADIEVQDSDCHDKGCCGHDIEDEGGNAWRKYLMHPLLHSLKIFAFILIMNVILSIVMYYAGDSVRAFLNSAYYAQPFISALVGLIPNCASSAIITELFLSGTISFGALMAGLCTNAGIAIAILIKQNKNKWNTVAIIGTMYVIASVLGLVISFVI